MCVKENMAVSLSLRNGTRNLAVSKGDRQFSLNTSFHIKLMIHTGWAKSRYTVILHSKIYTYFWNTLYYLLVITISLRLGNVRNAIVL